MPCRTTANWSAGPACAGGKACLARRITRAQGAAGRRLPGSAVRRPYIARASSRPRRRAHSPGARHVGVHGAVLRPAAHERPQDDEAEPA